MRTKRVKIIYLINGLGYGGAEMMLYRLLEKLDRSTFQPEVVVLLKIDSPLKQKIEDLGVPVCVVDFNSKLSFSAIIHLYKLVKKKAPDILHTQLFASDILGRIIGRILRVPIVITSIRNSYYGGPLREFLIKWTEKYADVTTIVSIDAARRFTERGVIPENKLQVVYNGLDPECFYCKLNYGEKIRKRTDSGLPLNGFLFLSVGSLSVQKGYPDLFKACTYLSVRNPDFYLAVAGSGPLRKELKVLIRDLGLEEKVVFLGHYDDVIALMAAADALVLSSHWEGLPGVVMEAMASELPVVATAVGGTPELVIDGETGYLVPAGASDLLAEAMEKVICLPDGERIAMGKAGRSRVKDFFHVEKMVNAYENIYHACLRNKNLL